MIGPSAAGNTPVGMEVGWSLPAWPATSPSISQRLAWKSSMKTCASSRLVWTQRPTPVVWRSEQRHHDAERQEIAGGEVADRDADAHRAAAGRAGDRHQAAHALGDLVDAARAWPYGPSWPKPEIEP